MAAHTQRRFLFLQGLASHFFSELAVRLSARGHAVDHVNFNGGDWLFWRHAGAVNYRGGLAQWPAAFARILDEKKPTDILLFGDCRPLHRAAIRLAEEQGITVHVFEEGYLRPNWITLERGGVNGHSHLPKEPEFYLQAAKTLPPLQEPPAFVGSFTRRALEDVLYNVTSLLLWPLYPGYKTHRPWPILVEYYGWIKRLALSRRAKRRMIREWPRLEAGKPFFFFPLQLDCDTQIRNHSSFGRLKPAIIHILTSFANHAPADHLLAIKEHPLDNGLVDWRRFIQKEAEKQGIADRIVYFEEANLDCLVRDSLGTVTVNSTVGALALRMNKPIIALGKAVYAMPGLTHQSGLDRFWTDPEPTNPLLFDAFKRVLGAQCLIPGGFFDQAGIRSAIDHAIERFESQPIPVQREMVRPVQTVMRRAEQRLHPSVSLTK